MTYGEKQALQAKVLGIERGKLDSGFDEPNVAQSTTEPPTEPVLEQKTSQLQTTASIVPTENDNLSLSAQSPGEMVQCHAAAIEWCKRKIKLVQAEAAELKAAFEHAKKCKWKFDTLERHWKLAVKRVEFFQKMLSAFDAGCYIVPNFPATVFAIRTDKDSPAPNTKIAYTYDPKMTVEITNPLPQGEGEYQNPEPIVEKEYKQITDSSGNKKAVADYWCDGWDTLEFPANMAKLHVMDSATRAMAMKVFDEICMLPDDRKRHADPILIGRIICKTKSPYAAEWKRVSFMLAWHIDTSAL